MFAPICGRIFKILNGYLKIPIIFFNSCIFKIVNEYFAATQTCKNKYDLQFWIKRANVGCRRLRHDIAKQNIRFLHVCEKLLAPIKKRELDFFSQLPLPTCPKLDNAGHTSAPNMSQVKIKLIQGRPKMEPRSSRFEPKSFQLDPRCSKIKSKCSQEEV